MWATALSSVQHTLATEFRVQVGSMSIVIPLPTARAAALQLLVTHPPSAILVELRNNHHRMKSKGLQEVKEVFQIGTDKLVENAGLAGKKGVYMNNPYIPK